MERDRLELDLSRLPQAGNVVLHPATIANFAQRLMRKSTNPYRASRARLEIALTEMDIMGEPGPVLRELIHSITVHDGGDYTGIEVQGYLTLYLRVLSVTHIRCDEAWNKGSDSFSMMF